ncbi:hypothetical protein HHUSO_G28535 [Huso huso]|uniref:Uncharacterized protein n=1 Tax=Huso huso TaxID=61971 RepID=A0ABR0YJD2_HUSHU
MRWQEWQRDDPTILVVKRQLEKGPQLDLNLRQPPGLCAGIFKWNHLGLQDGVVIRRFEDNHSGMVARLSAQNDG